MTPAQFIRSLLGPFEKFITCKYRGIFIDLTALASQARQWVTPSRILEIGCGEGVLTECLAMAYPDAYIIGIDITPRIGRLFQKKSARVIFKEQSVEKFLSDNNVPADLVVISDVLHHILPPLQRKFLTNARKCAKRGGYLVIKDWIRSNDIINFLAYFTDRVLAGDRVCYYAYDELRRLLEEIFGSEAIVSEFRIPPRMNNVCFLIRV